MKGEKGIRVEANKVSVLRKNHYSNEFPLVPFHVRKCYVTLYFPLKVWYAASYAEFVNQKIHDISEEERKGNLGSSAFCLCSMMVVG